MEELTLTTPSILFSAISLIMLAYTNRFLAYASVIRNLKKEHESNPSPITQQQMDNLRRRLHMTRSMQIYGVSSLLLCVVCTLLIYIGLQKTAVYTFGAALGLLVVSLCGRETARRTEQAQTFPEQKSREKAPRHATGSSARLAARQPQRITRREEPRSIARGYRSTPEARSRTCG